MMFSKKYVEQLESIIESLNMRIIELKNEVAETKYIKDVRFKNMQDKLDKIEILLNHNESLSYKKFRDYLFDIMNRRY